MIVYCVTIVLDAIIENDWVTWMKQEHIPDVLSTGCFVDCHIFRILNTEISEPTYVMQYLCRSKEDYDRYQKQFAPSLQKAHSDRYAGQFRGSRQVMKEV